MAVQGFGNVGVERRPRCSITGVTLVVAVSDVKGGIFNPKGLDIPALRHHSDGTGRRHRLRGRKGDFQ